jgi:hypothetical protein
MVMGVPADAKVQESYEAAGFQWAVHWLPSAPRGPVERALDRYEAAVAELRMCALNQGLELACAPGPCGR